MYSKVDITEFIKFSLSSRDSKEFFDQKSLISSKFPNFKFGIGNDKSIYFYTKSGLMPQIYFFVLEDEYYGVMVVFSIDSRKVDFYLCDQIDGLIKLMCDILCVN